MQEVFRKAVVVFYWIALPFVLLACAGSLIGAVLLPSDVNAWMRVAGSGLFAGVIGWRLWLNSRALGGGPLPPARRLLLVFLPLLVLALVGIGVATLGVVWMGLGFWVLLGPETDTSGFRDLVSGPALPLGTGAIMIVVGGALVLPLRRSLRFRPQPTDTF